LGASGRFSHCIPRGGEEKEIFLRVVRAWEGLDEGPEGSSPLDQVGQGAENRREGFMAAFNIYEAKTSLSQLVERAAKGEEIVIAKAGKPMVKMVPVAKAKEAKPRKSGQNRLGITYISDDFDEPLPDEMLKAFGYK
jgi:prevent-host-death family protein